jgi:hypothetical protein
MAHWQDLMWSLGGTAALRYMALAILALAADLPRTGRSADSASEWSRFSVGTPRTSSSFCPIRRGGMSEVQPSRT